MIVISKYIKNVIAYKLVKIKYALGYICFKVIRNPIFKKQNGTFSTQHNRKKVCATYFNDFPDS